MAEDITNPVYLTRPELGGRRARILSGRGTVQPGYTIVGSQPGSQAEGIASVRVVKMVSPLTGQGPISPRDTGRFSGMDLSTRTVRTVRQQRAVAPNTGSVVVRPPRTAIRKMNNSGQGSVSYV